MHAAKRATPASACRRADRRRAAGPRGTDTQNPRTGSRGRAGTPRDGRATDAGAVRAAAVAAGVATGPATGRVGPSGALAGSALDADALGGALTEGATAGARVSG